MMEKKRNDLFIWPNASWKATDILIELPLVIFSRNCFDFDFTHTLFVCTSTYILYKQFSSKHFPILRLLTCTSISRQKSLSLFRLMKWVCVFIYRLRSTLVNGSEKIGSVSWIPSVRGLIRTWRSSTYVSETCEKIERWLLKLQGAEIFWRASRGLASTFSRIRNFYRRVSVIDGFSIIFLLCI